MANITLKGNPLSTNHVYYHAGRGLSFLRSKAKALKEDYQWQAKSQWKKPPIETEIEVTIKIYLGTKRKADWDNFHKLSMDALNGIVWVDDSQIQRAIVEKFYDKENPRIEVEIYRYKHPKEEFRNEQRIKEAKKKDSPKRLYPLNCLIELLP